MAGVAGYEPADLGNNFLFYPSQIVNINCQDSLLLALSPKKTNLHLHLSGNNPDTAEFGDNEGGHYKRKVMIPWVTS